MVRAPDIAALPLAVIGTGGHGRVIADCAMSRARAGLEDRFQTIVFFDDKLDAGRRIEDLFTAGPAAFQVVIGIGNTPLRLSLGTRLLAAGFHLPVVAHARSIIAPDVTIQQGSVIMAGAIINPGAVIGAFSIVNTGASVDHDCRLGKGVHIAPGAHLAGTVTVGDRSMIATGASVRNNITIGADVMVGVGAAVVRNIENNRTVMGVPAR